MDMNQPTNYINDGLDIENHVFISYSRSDAKLIANNIYNSLIENEIPTWIDKKINPGIPFGSSLKRAINNSFVMIAVISPICAMETKESYWMKCEWCYAISRGYITIIPVVVSEFDEDNIPIELFPIPRIKLTNDHNEDMDTIIELVKFAKNHPPNW